MWQLIWTMTMLSYTAGEELTKHSTSPVQKEMGDTFDHPIRCPENADCGEPIILTPMLKNGRISDAQQAAGVKFPNTSEFQQVQNVQSYSGFFTVNETIDSNMFFWFFLSENEPKNAPLLLWLNGGPGAATSANAFLASGPFHVDNQSRVALGPNRWTQSMSILYIDNPVGAGFSFTRNVSGYATTQRDYTTNLYATLLQFFQLFPDFRNNEFFIGGVSYGGKYVPALAYEIHRKNPTTQEKINLKGIALCSGMVNPLVQISFSEFLYSISVIDLATKQEFAQIEDHIKDLIEKKKFTEASKELNQYMGFVPNKTTGAFYEVTGINVDNYLETSYNIDGFTKELIYHNVLNVMKAPLLKSIHVGRQKYWFYNGQCYDYLVDDLTRSVAPQLEVLMDNYRVLVYNGELEIMCSYLLMIEAVMNLNWKAAEEYRNATRHQWWVNGELAGYAKSAGNFTEVLVRNASHGCFEQPSWIIDLIRRFTKNLPLELK